MLLTCTIRLARAPGQQKVSAPRQGSVCYVGRLVGLITRIGFWFAWRGRTDSLALKPLHLDDVTARRGLAAIRPGASR